MIDHSAIRFVVSYWHVFFSFYKMMKKVLLRPVVGPVFVKARRLCEKPSRRTLERLSTAYPNLAQP
jgi:hypothetical protein